MGAIAPQRRISKTRKRQRRSHFKLELPGMMVCPNCGEVKLAHVVCEECGFYDGKQVKAVKAKVEEQPVEEVKSTKKASKKEKAEGTESKVVKKSKKSAEEK